MATWIAHLRLAENVLELCPSLNPCGFAVGNISPDSGLPNDDWSAFTPPTSVTHLKVGKDCGDLQFYRDYLYPLDASCLHNVETSFRLGYFCHLLADNLWLYLIGEPTKAKYAPRFAADPEFIWTVKEDWYALDFLYVRNHPDSLFWKVFLTCTCPPLNVPFLLVEGVQERIQYIQTYYQRADDEIETLIRQPRSYLTHSNMDDYVERSTQALQQVLEMLLDDKYTPPESGHTLLEMLPPQLKAPLF